MNPDQTASFQGSSLIRARIVCKIFYLRTQADERGRSGGLKVKSKFTGLEFSLSYQQFELKRATVVPTKSDSDVILCLQLLSKTLKCTLHLS